MTYPEPDWTIHRASPKLPQRAQGRRLYHTLIPEHIRAATASAQWRRLESPTSMHAVDPDVPLPPRVKTPRFWPHPQTLERPALRARWS